MLFRSNPLNYSTERGRERRERERQGEREGKRESGREEERDRERVREGEGEREREREREGERERHVSGVGRCRTLVRLQRETEEWRLFSDHRNITNSKTATAQ